MAGNYELLVFDWDGTLVDSAPRIVATVDAVVAELGLSPVLKADVLNVIGLGLPEALQILFPTAGGDMRQRITESYRTHFVHGGHPPLALFPGVRRVLKALRDGGWRLAVATGKSRAGLRRELRATGLAELFDSSRCADETVSKPHPQMLVELMDELGVAARETLMMGDTEYDLRMAQRAGTDSVAVTWGVHERGRLLKFNPCACLDSMDELVGWLNPGQAFGAR